MWNTFWASFQSHRQLYSILSIYIIISVITIEQTRASDQEDEAFFVSTEGSRSIEGDDLFDGLCNINIVRRKTYKSAQNWTSEPNFEISERAITCSNLTDAKWSNVLRTIYNSYHNKDIALNQIIIRDSEPSIVPALVDLFCSDRFDCSKMTVFNISNHKFQSVGNWIRSWPNLEILDLTNSSIGSIESILLEESSLDAEGHTKQPIPILSQQSNVLTNLTQLVLDFNQIKDLDFNFITKKMPNLRHLSLVKNSIFNITYNDNHLSRLKSVMQTLKLGNNSINCEKSQLKFIRLLHDPEYSQKFPDVDLIGCASPVTYANMKWAQRLSVAETKLCDKCICRLINPRAIEVNCNHQIITELPANLPINTKIIILTSNRLRNLNLPAVIKNWENVSQLVLDDNFIDTDHGDFREDLQRFNNLTLLDLRKNKLETLDSETLIELKRFDLVYLSDNPWRCKCSFMKPFIEWIQINFQSIGDEENIKCGISGNELNGVRSFERTGQQLAGKVIHRIPPKDLCPVPLFMNPFEIWDFLNILLFCTLLGLISKIIFDYLYEKQTKRMPVFYKLNFWVLL